MLQLFKRSEYIDILLIVSVSALLLLPNLGNQFLWQDEAQTALIGRTVLHGGIPLGYDGKNFFDQNSGTDYGQGYIWRFHPWIQFYVVGICFQFFGESTFVARLPFALFGIATLIMAYILAKKMFDSRRIALVSTGLLLFSVAFLLLVKQCRYYSPSMFFSLLSLYAYVNVLEKKKHAIVMSVISSTLLFHTNYFYCIAFLVTAGVHVIIFHRESLRSVIIAMAITSVLNAPWLLWFIGPSSGAGNSISLDRVLNLSGSYFSQIGTYFFPPVLVIASLGAMVVPYFNSKGKNNRQKLTPDKVDLKNKKVKNISMLIFFIIINIVMLCFFSPYPFFRYLAPLLPVFAIIAAVMLESLLGLHPFVVVAVGIYYLLFFQSASDYVYELTHDYDGPVEGIVGYLNTHGTDKDTVVVSYEDLPLKFYTNMKVVGGLTGENLSLAQHAQWIIVRKYTISDKDNAVKQYLIDSVNWSNYEGIVIPYPDIPFENREDLQDHNFKTVTDEDPVTIYRRLR